MTLQPLYSIYISPGLGFQKNQAQLEAGKWYVRFLNLQFITAVDVWMADEAWPADPLFLEITTDGDLTDAGTRAPLWTIPVAHQTGAARAPDNHHQFWQPLIGAQFDCQFRAGAAYPGGSQVKAPDIKTFSLQVLAPPTVLPA